MLWHKYSKTDRFLVVGSVVILLLSVIFIVEDRWLFRFLSTAEKDLERIGQVQVVTKDVRRRFSTAFAWAPLDKGSAVYQGDSIFTAQNSEAKIRTDQGEVISISPNSLVVINAKTDSIRLDINYGSVLGQVGKDKKLLIASGGDLTEFSGQDAVVKVDVGNDKNLVVNVLEGQVEVSSQDGKRTLGPQQSAAFGEGGPVVDASDVTVELITPNPDRIIRPTEAKDLILNWKSNVPLSQYILEVSSDPDFKNIVAREVTPRTAFHPQNLPTNTKLYWRVKGTLKKGETKTSSQIAAFTMAEDTPPSITFPYDGARLAFEDQNFLEGKKVAMSVMWQARSISRKWEVQLAPNADFSRDVRVFEAVQTSSDVGELSAGSYYLRVRSKDWPNANWSLTTYFSIAQRAPAAAKPPQVLTTDDKFLLNTKLGSFSQQELLNIPINKIAEYVEAVPELSWNSTPGATSYEIEFSLTRSFDQVLLRQQAPNTRFGWSSVSVGNFFWRTRAITSGGNKGRYSEPQPLTVRLAPPKNLTPEKVTEEVTTLTQMETPPPPYLLRWGPTIFSARYEVEFDKDPFFKKPLRVLTNNPFKKIQAPTAGNYFWRVRALTAKNVPVTDWSAAYPYNYERLYLSPETTKELRALYPNNETIMLVGRGQFKINFRWVTPIKDGQHRFQLSKDKNFATTMLDFVTDKDSYLLQKHLPDSWYYWRLRTETKAFTSPWTTAYQFKTEHQVEDFDFATSEKNQAETIQKYDKQRKIELAQEAKEKAELVARLAKEEEMTWPQLEAPIDLEGPKAYTLETQQLVQNQERLINMPISEHFNIIKNFPSFEWHPTTDATGYRIEFATDAEFKNLAAVEFTERTSLRWAKARPGKFFWRVIAQRRQYRDSPGSEVNAISIDLKAPDALTPHNLSLGSSSTVLLKWTPTAFAKKYLVEMGPSLNALSSKLAHNNSLVVKVDNPLFFWRVRPLDEQEKPIAQFANFSTINTSRITRTPASTPTSPKEQLLLLHPTKEQKLILMPKDKPRLTFEWAKEVTNATYVLELARDAKFKETFKRITTKENTAYAEIPAYTGKIYWKVSISRQGRVVKTSLPQGFTLAVVPQK